MSAKHSKKSGLFPDYFKTAITLMCVVTVAGAGGLGIYQLGLAQPASEISHDATQFADGATAIEGVKPIDGGSGSAGTGAGHGSASEGKKPSGEASKGKPAFGAGSYTVTTPSGINVREGAGTDAKRTGGKVRGSGVKVTETKLVGGDTWGHLAQGGWIAMRYDGHNYVIADKGGKR